MQAVAGWAFVEFFSGTAASPQGLDFRHSRNRQCRSMSITPILAPGISVGSEYVEALRFISSFAAVATITALATWALSLPAAAGELRVTTDFEGGSAR